MAKTTPKASRLELLQGTLDLIILQALRWGPAHGYHLVQLIDSSTQGAFRVDTGSLYPALHRLQRRRWIAATWELSENRQRIKVYRLTPAGQRQLVVERSRWDQLTRALAGIFTPPAREES